MAYSEPAFSKLDNSLSSLQGALVEKLPLELKALMLLRSQGKSLIESADTQVYYAAQEQDVGDLRAELKAVEGELITSFDTLLCQFREAVNLPKGCTEQNWGLTVLRAWKIRYDCQQQAEDEREKIRTLAEKVVRTIHELEGPPEVFPNATRKLEWTPLTKARKRMESLLKEWEQEYIDALNPGYKEMKERYERVEEELNVLKDYVESEFLL